MALDIPPGTYVNVASGLLLLGLGLWVASLRPRRRATLALGLFSASFGLTFVTGNALLLALAGSGSFGEVELLLLGANSLLVLTATASLLLVGLWVPRPLAARAALREPLAFGAAGFGTALLAAWGELEATASDPGFPPAVVAAVGLALAGISAATYLVLALLAARFRGAAGPAAAQERGQAALMSAALLLWLGTSVGNQLAISSGYAYLAGTPASAAPSLAGILDLALLVALAALWLRNASLAQGREARVARNVALLALAVPLVSVAATFQLLRYPLGLGFPQFGVARTLAVGALAYAILRRQLLGLDVKVKWTLKQSTVAAAFIGVFFVVSESASAFLAETGLGTYLGIAAAGMLVFAIAPLQRAAERVASAAMPGVKPVAELSRDDRARLYREQALAAWSDGSIDRSERFLLDKLQASLGLSADEARRIESEAARPEGGAEP